MGKTRSEWDIEWEEKFEIFSRYVRENYKLPYTDIVIDGVNVCSWWREQSRRIRVNRLSKKRAKKLKPILEVVEYKHTDTLKRFLGEEEGTESKDSRKIMGISSLIEDKFFMHKENNILLYLDEKRLKKFSLLLHKKGIYTIDDYIQKIGCLALGYKDSYYKVLGVRLGIEVCWVRMYHWLYDIDSAKYYGSHLDSIFSGDIFLLKELYLEWVEIGNCRNKDSIYNIMDFYFNISGKQDRFYTLSDLSELCGITRQAISSKLLSFKKKMISYMECGFVKVDDKKKLREEKYRPVKKKDSKVVEDTDFESLVRLKYGVGYVPYSTIYMDLLKYSSFEELEVYIKDEDLKGIVDRVLSDVREESDLKFNILSVYYGFTDNKEYLVNIKTKKLREMVTEFWLSIAKEMIDFYRVGRLNKV